MPTVGTATRNIFLIRHYIFGNARWGHKVSQRSRRFTGCTRNQRATSFQASHHRSFALRGVAQCGRELRTSCADIDRIDRNNFRSLLHSITRPPQCCFLLFPKVGLKKLCGEHDHDAGMYTRARPIEQRRKGGNRRSIVPTRVRVRWA